MNRQTTLRAIFAVLGLAVGFALVIDRQSSNMGLWFLASIYLILAPIALLFLAVAGKWKVILYFILVPPLLGFLAFQCFNWFYFPSNIRWSFGSPPGSSGSYHTVQFFEKVGNAWIEGPEVEGWPMRVAFPDLNSDGYRDIRVVEEKDHRGESIEFIHIPNATDGVHWKTHRMDSRLSAAYKPAGISHNNP
jgi:energy-coupling factor transporter transmembrane protein EcfT